MSWRQLIASLCLCVAVQAGFLYRQQMTREASSCEGRKSAGVICESCELLATCVRHSNGWVNIPVESCDVSNGFYCNALLGACSNATGPCHPIGVDGHFQCSSQGIFPDPYDCQKYHMCYFVESTLVAATVDCGSDRAFDARTAQCSLTLQSRICTERQYQCLHAGYVAAWPTNPNIFYVCKSTVNQSMNDTVLIYPSLHRCNDGEIFDEYSFECRSVNGNTNSSALTPPAHEDSDTDTVVTVVPGHCGYVGLMSDPNNCRMYYYCTSLSNSPRHLDCPTGSYFKGEISACVIGNC